MGYPITLKNIHLETFLTRENEVCKVFNDIKNRNLNIELVRIPYLALLRNSNINRECQGRLNFAHRNSNSKLKHEYHARSMSEIKTWAEF